MLITFKQFSHPKALFFVVWHSDPESDRLKTTGIDPDPNPYQSFCDERFKYYAYPHLYYLCKDYGFDIDDLPELFDEWNKIKEQNLGLDPEFKGELSGEQLIEAVSTVVGKDASKVFYNVCYIHPEYPECNK